MANIKIEELPPTSTQARTDLVPVQKDGGSTNKLTIAQILGLIQAGDFAAIFHALTAKTSLADTDELTVGDSAASWSLKRVTLTNLIASIFKTARTIANARFQASTFGLMFGSFRRINSGTLTADRTDSWPDRSVDLSFVPTGVYQADMQLVANPTDMVFTHGLGVIPADLDIFLLCKNPAGVSGFALGEATECSFSTSASGGTEGLFAKITSSTITLRMGAGLRLLNFTTNALFTVVPSDWNVRVRLKS